ncbi:Os02g0769300 [Oryza sativa Japonica Group]|uniref:Os02g0769300 protein n=1 Tax=Oryza sativa subsp. japonica TaxID=39947 RepID=A0A0P0VQ48_ORYSJ|nr:Os02g0769300 [Oryza sativa Japonica Group]
MQTYGPVRRCVVAGWYVRLPCPREWATGRSAALPPRIRRGARFRGARARVRVRVRERESVPASPARRAATQRAATGIVGVAGGVGARARSSSSSSAGVGRVPRHGTGRTRPFGRGITRCRGGPVESSRYRTVRDNSCM